jgi:chromosome segregation ATPase
LRTLDAARLKGDIDQEEYGKACTAAQQGNDEKLKELFGIDRLATMQSSASQPDNVLEHALHKLNASNDQISSVLKLEQNYAVQRTDLERQMQNNSGNPASLQEKLQALDASRDLQYQTVLGADASGSLQKEKDYRYQAMKQHADAWDLNDSQIDYVYQDIQSYQKKVDDYQRRARAMEVSGETVDWDAVNQILIQFSLQNKQTLEDYLGVDQFNKLQKNYLLPFSQPQ